MRALIGAYAFFMHVNRFSLFTFLICFSCQVWAQGTLSLSLGAMDFDYREFESTGHTLDSEQGVLPGVDAVYTFPLQDLQLTFGGAYYGGEVDYDGQLQNGMPHQAQTKQALSKVFAELSLPVKETGHTLFATIAYRQWDRDIQPTASASGLFERYRWLHYKLGGRFKLFDFAGYHAQLKLAYMHTFDAQVRVDLEHVGLGRPELHLGSKPGGVFGVKLSRKLTERSDLGIDLGIERFEFGKSDSQRLIGGASVYSIEEPASQSTYTYLRFSYNQKF